MSQEVEFIWNGDALKGRVREAGMRGVDMGMEFLLGEAVKIVPHAEGILQDSGKVVPATEALEGSVVFDTPYAVIQHEAMDFVHPNGRQAKYLETPFMENQGKIGEIVANAIRQAIG